VGKDGPGGVFRETAVLSHSHPQNILSKSRDFENGFAASYLDAVAEGFTAGDSLQDGEQFLRGNRRDGVCLAHRLFPEGCRSKKDDGEKSERRK
jgi:hypothetical protein